VARPDRQIGEKRGGKKNKKDGEEKGKIGTKRRWGDPSDDLVGGVDKIKRCKEIKGECNNSRNHTWR